MINWDEWSLGIDENFEKWSRERLEENVKKAFGKFDQSILEHPKWEEVDDMITTLMCEYGPDGHCDGHGVITYYIVSQFIEKGEEKK